MMRQRFKQRESGLLVPDRELLTPRRQRPLMMSAPQQMLFGTSGASNDPNFSSVVWLMHMDGSNGSTTFTDSSSHARSATANGSAQLETSTIKFGSASGQFSNGSTTGNVSTTRTSDFEFAAGDWTVEAWVYPQTISSLRFIQSNRTSTGNNGWFWYMNASGKLVFNANEGTLINNVTSSASLTLNAWNFISAERSGGNFYMHIGGILDGSGSGLGTTAIGTSNGTNVYAGSATGETGNRDWQGFMDEVRMTKGVSRYGSGNYSVPTSAFPNQ